MSIFVFLRFSDQSLAGVTVFFLSLLSFIVFSLTLHFSLSPLLFFFSAFPRFYRLSCSRTMPSSYSSNLYSFTFSACSTRQIQAALPNGARLRARGRFEAHMLQPWVTYVEEAETALQLMEAWLLLETSINPRWLEPGYTR